MMERTFDSILDDVDVGDDGCWRWNRSTQSAGYGQVMIAGRHLLAHRAAWILYNGELPSGLGHVHHTCETRTCINPLHLVLLSQQEHNDLHGPRGAGGKNKQKTVCLRGHPFDETNTRHRTGNRSERICKTCANERSARWLSRQKNS